MKPRAIIISVGALVLLILTFSSFFVVNEWEQVVITKFGEPIGEPIRTAGLKFKMPFIHSVNRFDRRILEWDGAKQQIPTADKRFIWLDTTARWKIVDPLMFLRAVKDIEGADSRLGNVLEAATRDVISSKKLAEVVRNTNRVLEIIKAEASEDLSARTPVAGEEEGEGWRFEPITVGRDAIADTILENSRAEVAKYGVELIDVRIKRINYVRTVRDKVYERMRSERKRIADRYRSEGYGRAQEILGRMQKEQNQISSTANREAEEIRAKAELEAAGIYNEAFGADPEFYHFWRSLQAYEKIVDRNHTLVVSPESDLYRYLFEMGKDE